MTFSLATVQTERGPRAAILVGDRFVVVASATHREQDRTVEGLLAEWETALPRLDALAAKAARIGQDLAEAQLLAPVLAPGAIFCAGANYADHVLEMAIKSGMPTPVDPRTLGLRSWHFLKTMHCIAGPGATVVMQPRSQKIDWEAELAVIIGKFGRNIAEEDALDYVAGYTIANDISARDLGHRTALPESNPFRHDWIAHKNWDGSCPLGPWITLRRDVPNERELKITLEVNGVLKQNSNSGQMIFNINEQIADLSRNFALRPGDIILTGTPAGVGAGRGEFLKKGDVVRVKIDRLGELVNTMA